MRDEGPKKGELGVLTEVERKCVRERRVDDCLRAGEVSIHSDLLLHGSNANASNRRRCGLTLRYAPAYVRAAQGWNAKGVILSGRDADAHWGNPPRPGQD